MRGLWFTCLILAALSAHGAAPDEEFLAAREAFRAGNAARLDAHAKRLQGHVLEPYVAYWQLSLKLADVAPEHARAFIAAHGDSPLSERLRADWLKQLGKAQKWDQFEQELPQLARPDLEITCYALQSRLRNDGGEALQEARAVWFIGRELPESCVPLTRALVAAEMIGTEDMWLRIRSLLEAGRVSLARRTAEHLPAGQRPDPRALAAAASDPAAFLAREKPNPKTRAARETVMFAVHRLARISAPQAARHWTRLEERFDGEARAYVWGLIGYFGALRHDPEALSWYARGGDLSDRQLAWKARAALRAGDWPEVLAAVEGMTERESTEPAWRYWRARALKAAARIEEAEDVLGPLATEFNFYGQLALEELGGAIAVPAATYKPSAEDVEAMSQHAGFRRALELYRHAMRVEGNREWQWTIRGFDDKQLLAAAELARRYEVYDRAISTADRTVELHDFGLRYVAPYRDVLKAHVARLDLDEAWVYGLIRQESRFVTDAKSRAGASGLMQLMPATARWVAKQIGLRDWRWSKVTDVDVNVSLGTYYLKHVLDHLDGHPVLASAAYNAGPSRARAWRPEAGIEGAVFAETIPFAETRDYVKKVMSNATYYAHAFSEQVQSLKERLGVIGPRQRDRETPLEDIP